MAEYIEREMLIKDFQSCGASSEIIDAIVYRINLHEAADVAPVRHGRWLIDGYTGKEFCSNCGDIPECFEPKFCPNCGAKMDLE